MHCVLLLVQTYPLEQGAVGIYRSHPTCLRNYSQIPAAARWNRLTSGANQRFEQSNQIYRDTPIQKILILSSSSIIDRAGGNTDVYSIDPTPKEGASGVKGGRVLRAHGTTHRIAIPEYMNAYNAISHLLSPFNTERHTSDHLNMKV